MNNNNLFDELLIAYLVGDIDPDDKEIVENWIDVNKENRQYFESFRKAWQLAGEEKALNYILDEINVNDKWNQIRQVITKDESKIVSINKPLIKDEEDVQQDLRQQPGFYKFLLRIAIAASVILVLGLGWKFFFNYEKEIPVTRHIEKTADSLKVVLRHELNTTGKEKRVQLADGSLVVLADKSEIYFEEPFSNKRDITLIGKAFFKVAKDRSRPFTVISGEISTTALGTEFTVTTFKNNNQIIVRLYEGKVVVKSIDKNNKKLKNNVYLNPGQSFVYNTVILAKVSSMKVKIAPPEQILKQEFYQDNPSVPENSKTSYFMFNNQPLSEVFDVLAGLYDVNIIYDKKDVDNLYFIGKYNSTDSLESILKRIAVVNNLTVTRKDEGFIISR